MIGRAFLATLKMRPKLCLFRLGDTGKTPPHQFQPPRMFHASWLNQVEIYFSIVQRKVLTPNDFSSLQELQQRLLAFQSHYERSASPFNWAFTRRDLNALLAKIDVKRLALAA